MKRLIFVLLFSILLSACGGGGGGDNSGAPSPPPPSVDVTGIWAGSYNSSVFGVQSLVMSLQQNGSSVTGTYVSSSGAEGDILGSVSGLTFDFDFTITTPTCIGNFDGSSTINKSNNPYTMTFSYSGSSRCGGNNETGTGNCTKQP